MTHPPVPDLSGGRGFFFPFTGGERDGIMEQRYLEGACVL